MSRAVSDPTQKNGGDSHRPIFNAVGTTSSALPRDTGLPLADGREEHKFRACRCDTTRHLKLSVMSSMGKRKGKSRF